MLTLTICIVNWNTRELLAQSLTALREHCGRPDVRAIVVDNASSDGSAEMVRERFPEVTLIANSENRGYAAASNQALRQAEAEFHLLLNPDVIVTPGAVPALLDFLHDHPQAAAVAPQLRYPDGRVQASCRGFPSPWVVLLQMLGWADRFAHSRTVREYRLADWGHDSERQVDQPMASALLLRGRALREVGLFDEDCPIFFNDVDLCYRLQQAGWEVWFTPSAQMIHHAGSAIALLAPRERLERWYQGWAHYHRKHFRRRTGFLAFWAARALLACAFAAQWLRITLRPADRLRRFLRRLRGL